MSEVFTRQTVIFFLPLDMEALSSNYGSYSGDSDGPDSDSSGWDKRQLYINPQSFVINDRKLVQPQLTKGGHVVQYWGEDLTTISLSGHTGASGVEGINVLRDIYRHEQNHYRRVLLQRQRAIAAAAQQAAIEAEKQMYESNVGGFFAGAADALTGGGFSTAVKGVSNMIDIAFGTELGDDYGGDSAAFRSTPTLAAFATNIDLYFQGEFFRGFFTTFNVTESAQEPGHFTYQMNFTVTRRSGKRNNFMPWHRNPLSADGETVMSQPTSESKGSWPGVERLSFLPSRGTWRGDPQGLPAGETLDLPADALVRSSFDPENTAEEDPLISRRKKVTG